MQIHAELLSHEGATLDLRLSSPGVLAACVDEAVRFQETHVFTKLRMEFKYLNTGI